MTRDDPAAFAPPPAFGPFRVLHQIGIGALGPVFRTYEPTRDRLVAVKMFRLDVTPEQAQSLADELARAADAGLFHPSIVEPVAAGVEGTSAYRAEEYVAAESLDVAMRHYAPATLDVALPFLTQLAGAIDFARTAGVGHGALHLRDVFVTPDEARASGFGIVEALERVGVRAPVRRPYSAPERIAGAEWSTPADVFSLAAIAYELLTGRRPSGTGEQIGDVSGDNLGGKAVAIRSVLARAMQEDPTRRYATALGFASALEAAAHAGTTDHSVIAIPQLIPDSPRSSSTGTVATAPTLSSAVSEPALPPVAPIPVSRPVSAAPPAARVPDATETEVTKHEDTVEEDDVAAERDADAAHHLLTKDMAEEPVPTLFDDAEDESVADLALDSTTIAADHSSQSKYDHLESGGPIGLGNLRTSGSREDRSDTPAFWSARHIDDVPPSAAEQSRSLVLPITLTLLLGLLLGSVMTAYMMGAFEGTPTPPAQAAVEESKPASPPAAAAGSAQPGRVYSEQAVTPQPQPQPQPTATAPRSGEPPPVPGDVAEPDAAAAARPPAPAANSQSARLTVISTPKRAVVTVNGRWRGRTPLTLDSLRYGSYTVKVVQPGFTSSSQEVVLNARQPMRTLSVNLQPVSARAPSPRSSGSPASSATTERESESSSYSGTIYVDSRPRGAKVLIDGKAMGTTPASIPHIPIGSHVVRLELADHRTWTTSTRVAAGEQARVTGSLEPIR